jgi:hypothetical protein
MYAWSNKRKQTDLKTNPFDYLILASEPADQQGSTRTPSFKFVNRYLVKRQLMRKIRHLRNHQHKAL